MGRECCLPTSRLPVVEEKVVENAAMAASSATAPPGMRTSPDSYKKDGSRYRPGERLERQARAWAQSQPGFEQPAPTNWTRNDAKSTLARLMAEMSV
jgi:hypothetical protein